MNSLHLSCSFALVAFTAFGASSAHAGTLYVNFNASTGANDGSSWSDAFQGSSGLQSALAIATSGDQIWVAQGAYLPASNGAREFSFGLKPGVAIYGGFAGGETDLSQRDVVAHVTILSGDLNGDDASSHFSDNSYHVVVGGGFATGVVLDGFTISGGNANGNFDYDVGGGIAMLNLYDAVIAHCVVRDNHATAAGGGLFQEQSSPTIIDSRFESNTAVTGGGLCALLSGAPIVNRCVFTANTANLGGAIYVDNTGYAVVHPLRIVNCLVYGNTTNGPSAAMHIVSQLATVADCTIVGNSAGAGPAIFSDEPGSVLINSIVYFNTGSQGPFGQVRCNDVRWCCVQGGYAGPGNIGTDPQFVNLRGGDFTLSLGSACIDAGNNNLVPTGTMLDLGLHPRFIDDPTATDTGTGSPPIVDMGGYEAPNHLYSSFCAADASLPTACPCLNFGQQGRGCADSDDFSVGALQTATGTVNPDTVVLIAADVLPSVLCIFLQGDVQNPAGVVFGDGVRCVAGHLLRLAAKNAVNGVCSFPQGGDPSITTRSAQLGDTIASGSMRFYQTYYRDPMLGFCPAPQGNTWNVTNAIAVQW